MAILEQFSLLIKLMVILLIVKVMPTELEPLMLRQLLALVGLWLIRLME